MVAVPEVPVSDAELSATGRAVVAAHRRRVVVIAVSPMELLRPASDLVRLIEGFSHIDLLVASEDVPDGAPGTLGLLGGGDPAALAADELGDEDEDDDEHDDLHGRAAGLGLAGLHLHRLGLRSLLAPRVEDDLVAAMSELVGFDPEPGVYCLAPVVSSPSGVDPNRVVVDRAAQRIAQVYGLPLLRYRCLELAVVDEETLR